MYFSTNAPEDRIMSVQASLEKLPEVETVTYTSREEAVTIFRERHKDDYLTIQALDELEENPLGASLAIKAHDSAQYDAIVRFIEGDNGPARLNANIIDKINYHQNKVVIDRLNAIIAGARNLGFAVTLVLMVISVIITLNTIRLTIFIAKEEIGVMRLVGAANKYIRGPFMVEGIVYGLISAVITLVLFFPITLWFGKSMTAFLGMNLYTYYMQNFIQIFLIVLGSGVILGAVSSFLAVHKYLKK
jgi:cell division transport system permease protein